MKVIFVNQPLQHSGTIDPQIIDGKIYYWNVRSEGTKLDETFHQWWIRKQEYIKNNPKYDNVEGIFLYDVQGIGGIVDAPNKAALFIRYDWIKKEEIKI